MQHVGNISIDRHIEMEFPFVDPLTFLPDCTQEALDANADWLKPRFHDPETGNFIFAFQSYILRTGRHTILVDTCVGNHKPRPARPAWDMMDGPWLTDLGKAGVQPEDVDFVMCTHLHVDHVGWNTQLVDGRWVPTFPNAKYVFAEQEYRFWEDHHKAGTTGAVPNVFDDSVLPVMDAGQAVLVANDHQFDDNIWIEPAPGHTPGNIVVNLKDGDDRAVLSGDVIHHPMQLRYPDWSSRACEDAVQSAKTRRALIEKYAETDILIAPAHFASPTMGHIVRKDDAFAFRMVEGG